MRPLVVIACGEKKAGHACRARDLYVGPYFRQALATAERITVPARVRILSGKHGLLGLEDIIQPYEQRIDRPGAISLEALRAQVRRLHLDKEPEVILLVGKAYLEIAKQLWPGASTPLQGDPQFLRALKSVREQDRVS